MLEALRQDLRYGVRALVKSPLFAATAILSLAIGIGANTTIFSVASAILKPDVWLPMSMVAEAMPRMSADLLTNRRAVWLLLGGRLKPGVTTAQANAEVAAIGAALEREYPQENAGKGFRATPSAVVPGRIQVVAGFIGLLMAIVGLVLVIACVNVSGMLLARGAGRRREIAVRLAIGASRGRLIRQLLTETVLLFVAGGATGVVITGWLTSMLLALLPQLPVPLFVDIGADWRVLSFAIGLSLIAANLAGLAPAFRASRSALVPALKSEGLDAAAGRLRLRSAFVVGQVALSLILVIAAGLFLRALQHAASIDPGFDERNVDVISLDLSLAGYEVGTAQPFLRELVRRVTALGGVETATAAIDLPLDGSRFGLGGLRVPGMDLPGGRESLDVDWNVVEPGYFKTLRLRLALGRDFDERDTKGAQPVAIVNEALARLARPGQNPIGRQVEHLGETRTMLTVVGVASNARLVSLDSEPGPFVYVPFAQQNMSRVQLLVRTVDGRTIVPEVREILKAMNPHRPITEAMPFSQVTALGLVPQRIAATVAGSLGVVGLLLAGIGLYGVTAYAVSRRTREIGIRMALGADRRSVLRLILRQALLLAGTGVMVGVFLAGIGSRLLESLLFGVPGVDPFTFAGASALFGLMTLVASYVPARRALRVNPVDALRSE